MSAQTRYGYSTPIGAAGGIVDIAPYAIDTFLNEEKTGTMKFGMGVVNGTAPGKNVKLPATGAVETDFCGITVNGRTTEYDMEGKCTLRNGASVGVMQYGRVYARLAEDAEPTYGAPVYVVISGDDAGCVTNDSTGTVAINGRFIGGADAANGIAAVELFNSARVVAAAANEI